MGFAKKGAFPKLHIGRTMMRSATTFIYFFFTYHMLAHLTHTKSH